MSLKGVLYSAPPKITARIIAAVIAVLLTLVSIRITSAFISDKDDSKTNENEAEDETVNADAEFERSELDNANAIAVGTVVSGNSAILCNLSDCTVIAEKNQLAKVSIGDATVFMAALTVSRAISDGRVSLTDEAVCPASAAKLPDYSSSEDVMPIGKRMKVGDILKCMLYQRGPSYAYTLAVHISGSDEAFTAEMNNYALELKLNDTLFLSCTGNGTSSAYDIAVIIKHVLSDPLLKEILCSDDMLTVGYGQSGSIELVVKNDFFENYCTESQAKSDGITGGKVGTADNKGWSAVMFEKDGKVYLSLVLDSKDAFSDALMLYTAYVLSVES